MGLDMYLHARRYISGYKHNTPENIARYNAVLAAAGIDSAHGQRCNTPSVTVEATVAYWRKANQIHNWFVQQVQEGSDDCQNSSVSREQLKELRDLCKEVIGLLETVEGDVGQGTSYYPDGKVEHHTKKGRVVAQKGIAEAKLPAAEGFFFGSTDYDEYYIADLEDTITMLTAVLDDETLEDCDFYYHSSW